jgi:hypothetical protein
MKMLRIVIVGSGLGGSYLASTLINNFDVLMVDVCDLSPKYKDRLRDVAIPSVSYPTIESGKGGTTRVWHNALMEVDSEIFDKSWPYPKKELIPFYEKAYLSLLGTSRESMISKSESLRSELKKIGFPEKYLKHFMVVPEKRVNAYYHNGLEKKVQFLKGEVVNFNLNSKINRIDSIDIRLEDGSFTNINAEIFVLSAGGLGTPILLQILNKNLNIKSLDVAGKYYDDHMMAYVGEVELSRPLYKFWNLPIRFNKKKGNMRFPFSFYMNQIQISLQLRPAYQLKVSKPREKVLSFITDIRNNPFKIKNYFKLIKNLDDIIEILSLKFGLVIPTKKYSLLLVTQHPADKDLAIWKAKNSDQIIRKWKVEDVFLEDLNKSIIDFIDDLGDIVIDFRLFSTWKQSIYSGAHHSGTARMGKESESSVCDTNCKVFNIDNLFISDASVLPASGFANTGLTIVAIAYKLGEYLKNIYCKNNKLND